MPPAIAGFPPRAARLAALEDALFDVLVIGGGITGCATARDAAARGLRVALLDREDWGAGTSWRSSKLVHGGLRYLRTGQFHLVFESLRERARLIELASHLVEPLDFLFPAYRGRGVRPLVLEAGLALYDLLALGRSPRRHRRLSQRALLEAERFLESPDLLSGALYADARTDDARLTFENALDASVCGAVAVTGIAVESFRTDRTGRLSGVVAEDRETGRRLSISARVVINATGPWADELRRRDVAQDQTRLRLSRGAHLSFPASRLPLRFPVAASAPGGRLLFAIPYGPVTLVGTTDFEHPGDPGDVWAQKADVADLLHGVNQIFPGARLTASDVVATFAGLRPLLAQTGRNVQDTSREDAVMVSRSGLLTVFGGKLTTHRRMADRVLERAAARLRTEGWQLPPSATASRPFPGAPPVPMPHFVAAFEGEAERLGLSSESARHLARRYGRRAEGVLAILAENRELAAPLVTGLPDIAAEIVFAARFEDARSLSDALVRRTHLFWQAPRQGEEALERAADLLARELRWSPAAALASAAEYRLQVARSRAALME